MAAVAESAILSGDRQFSHHRMPSANPPRSPPSSDCKTDLQHKVTQAIDVRSKLNPAAKEFFPSSKSSSPTTDRGSKSSSVSSANAPVVYEVNGAGQHCTDDMNSGNGELGIQRRGRNFHNQGKRVERHYRNDREESIRRTIYISDIDVTEEQLASLFSYCGPVVDCRVCGDPNSLLRFAFIEFADEQGARRALSLSGTMIGFQPLRVLPSKTAIVPVNPTFLPRSQHEREMCTRTIYCTNIDKKVTQTDLKAFFEASCGEVSRLRLLGDHDHSTRIGFVEFFRSEGAIIALNQSGVLLGDLPIRVSPSKTPVRPRIPRAHAR